MTLPFSSTQFDILYANVADTLKVKYPQTEEETMYQWYKRLLYELMAYIDAIYEPVEDVVIVNAKKKTNKKRKNENKKPVKPVENPTIFEENLEKALEVVSQDPKFGIYLFAWWLPILVKPTDWFELCIFVHCSDTPAHKVALKSIELKFELMYSKITVKSINGLQISKISKTMYDTLIHDPFVGKLFKLIHKFRYNNSDIDYNSFKNSEVTQLNITEASTNSFKLARFLLDIQQLLQALFISSIVFKSNLIGETPETNKINISKNKEKPRKKFNARKFLQAETITSEEMSSHIIETVVISIFRTFYDYDEQEIDDELFQYLFFGKSLNNLNL